MSYANHPNAALIDEVLAHVRAHPQRWVDVPARGAAREAAWNAAFDAARNTGCADARYAALAAATDAADDALRASDVFGMWDAACALIAYPEEAAALIRQEPDVVRMVASTGNHAAVLLLPATIAMASKG